MDHENARLEKALVGEGPIRASRGKCEGPPPARRPWQGVGEEIDGEAKEKNRRREKPTRCKGKGEKEKKTGKRCGGEHDGEKGRRRLKGGVKKVDNSRGGK